jgi:hypothetical protein
MIEFTDRYGGQYPNVGTCCDGMCEGTGIIPVDKDDMEEPYRSLWLKAEEKDPTEDGWHFVECPDCKGSGKND